MKKKSTIIFVMLCASSLLLLAGCATAHTYIVPADQTVHLLRAGQTFTATNDVWLVPPKVLSDLIIKAQGAK